MGFFSRENNLESVYPLYTSSGVLSSQNCIFNVKPRKSGFRRRAWIARAVVLFAFEEVLVDLVNLRLRH